MSCISEGSLHAEALLAKAATGDTAAWGKLLSLHQGRLVQIVEFRLDRRLRGRLDATDVLQEAFLSATARRAEFFQQSSQPLFLWLRWMVRNKLLEIHRQHLGVQMRDARRECSYGLEPSREDSGESIHTALINHLTAGKTGPSTAAGRAELHERLKVALEKMDETDREVLALRHYEQLTSAETARVLEIQERAAAKRYTRALIRLREILADMPGGLTGLRP